MAAFIICAVVAILLLQWLPVILAWLQADDTAEQVERAVAQAPDAHRSRLAAAREILTNEGD